MMRLVIEKKLNKVKASSFIKSVLSLSSGIVLGQVALFLAMPIIGRLYSQSEIGEYQIISSSSIIISTLAVLGLMTAIMLPKDDEEAHRVGNVIFTSLFYTSLFGFLIIVLISNRIKLFNVSFSYILAIAILVIDMFLNYSSSIYYSYINRDGNYNVLFWKPIIWSVSQVLLLVLFGYMSYGAVGYCIAILLSHLISIIYMRFYCKVSLKLLGFSNFKATVAKYKEFPTLQMPTNFINTMAIQLPNQALIRLFDSTTLGTYGMASKILHIPINFLATPINKVYYKQAAQHVREGRDIGDLSFKIIKNSVVLAIIPISIVCLFGEEIFRMVLGSSWVNAGTYAAILALTALMQFCSSCLSGSFILISKQKLNLAFSIFDILLSALAFILARIWSLNPVVTLGLYSIANVISRIVTWGVFFRYTKLKMYRYWLFVLYAIIAPGVGALLLRILIRSYL